MNRRVKILLYSGLGLIALAFLYGFLSEYRLVNEQAPNASGTRLTGYLGAFVVTIIVLGLLAAYEFTHFISHKAHDLVFNDTGDGIRDPGYEEAEKLWANGQHLDAIGQLREFLQKDPRQIHAAIRIAEIYEKDLNNPLAAALEYEDILQKNLPPERWGWAGIHLVNLYSGSLNKPDQAMEWLERIARRHPHTSAAKKARERLGLPEPEPPAAAESPGETPSEASESSAPPKSNLPPGFRPK
jgi:hypothetical protein